jgi:surfeit locus 1 family protein
MRISLFKRESSFTWLGVAVYLALMILLCNLGFWQISRSTQKTQLLEQQQAAAQADAVDLNRQAPEDSEAVRYQKVSGFGLYDANHQFLVDNQVLNGKPGYFVLTPFLLDGGKQAVLVNRGWVALGKDRSVIPDIGIKLPVQHIVGRINHFPAVGIRLKGAEIPTDNWPATVQVVDSQVLSAKIGYELYDFQIELDAEQPEGYQRQWKITTIISPEKHIAYAVQWFGLALTLTVLFFWKSSRKSSEYTA